MTESDITDFIADFVAQDDPELGSRMEYQAAALREAVCTDPASFGRWVDANDVKLLYSAFALKDEDFSARFPKMSHMGEPQRRQFIASLEVHFETCKHCSLKRGYDFELDGRIKKACQQNKELLLQLLKEEEAESSKEGEHRDAKLELTI
jgi:hypothetical protein